MTSSRHHSTLAKATSPSLHHPASTHLHTTLPPHNAPGFSCPVPLPVGREAKVFFECVIVMRHCEIFPLFLIYCCCCVCEHIDAHRLVSSLFAICCAIYIRACMQNIYMYVHTYLHALFNYIQSYIHVSYTYLHLLYTYLLAYIHIYTYKHHAYTLRDR